jgi:hypothetical protein
MKPQNTILFIMLSGLVALLVAGCGIALSTLPIYRQSTQDQPTLTPNNPDTDGPLVSVMTEVVVQTATSLPARPTPTPTPFDEPFRPGSIQGKVCFPGEAVPEMMAYFQEINTGAWVELPIAPNQSTYQKNLPPGDYLVYAWVPGFELGGSYSEYVKCGLNATCYDHMLLPVAVKAGEITGGADICDWYGGEGSVPYPPGYKPLVATPVPTEPPPPCDWAQFERDVTVVDGARFDPGESFTKVWRLSNLGSCTWNASYALVFVGGDGLGADRVIYLPGNVWPGQTVDLGVKMTAPEKAGEYQGYWQLRNAKGLVFGVGKEANKNIWVSIQVEAPRYKTVYDFAKNYCEADWASGAGSLDCSGDLDSEDGFVSYLDNPDLENRQEDEPALWVHPDVDQEGWISGTFPIFEVKEGDHFRSWVGCMANAEGCKVEFSLGYQKKNGKVKNLGVWVEKFEGKVSVIDLDLSDLAGKDVRFILTVKVRRNPEQANGFWFVPRIDRVE